MVDLLHYFLYVYMLCMLIFISTAGQPGQFAVLSCNFESNKCGYTDDAEDFKWIRKSGPTISSNTGPTQDHTKGTSSGSDAYKCFEQNKYIK